MRNFTRFCASKLAPLAYEGQIFPRPAPNPFGRRQIFEAIYLFYNKVHYVPASNRSFDPRFLQLPAHVLPWQNRRLGEGRLRCTRRVCLFDFLHPFPPFFAFEEPYMTVQSIQPMCVEFGPRSYLSPTLRGCRKRSDDFLFLILPRGRYGRAVGGGGGGGGISHFSSWHRRCTIASASPSNTICPGETVVESDL